MADCPCVSLKFPRTVLLSKKLFHFLLTCFILKSPSSFSMGKYWPILPSTWTPPFESRQSDNSNAIYKAGSHHPAVLSLAQLKFWGQGHLWTQVGSPVKSLLKPQSQNLNGAHFPTPTKVKNYASHRSDSMVLVRVVFQPHWFCDSVIWSAAASMESLKKELGLHQEDSDSGPFQLLRLTPPFSHSAENYYCHSKPGSLQQSALPLHRFGSAWLR